MLIAFIWLHAHRSGINWFVLQFPNGLNLGYLTLDYSIYSQIKETKKTIVDLLVLKLTNCLNQKGINFLLLMVIREMQQNYTMILTTLMCAHKTLAIIWFRKS